MSAIVHEFRSSVELEREGRALFDAGYRKLFGAHLEDQHIMRSTSHQRAGVDVLVFLRSGRTVSIDEKVRRHGISSADVALEIEHINGDGSREPGWLLSDTRADMIGFAWLSDSVVWLLPFQNLVSAYQRKWSSDRTLRWIEAKNVSGRGSEYITRSIVVPKDRVVAAVGAALRTQVRP